ncbi:MAG TPA: methionyl-tRNA formyltransferase [Thermoanaerobaculia bacterium]|nr:methionyl-tRNA formyltransferase [Thermoanaerobaculia bacterium]
MAVALERIVFFGTPEFAVPTLDALVEAGREPALVVTRPARPAGRGQAVQEPPVAEAARRHGIAVAQPARVRDPEEIERLRAIDPDLFVVVAFGQIFPAALLELPKHGSINLHASLLPKYRGASPIQSAIANGEKKTGVTTMLMEEALDAGPILLQEEVEIRRGETAGELAERLAKLGADLMAETLGRLEKSLLKPRKQREESSSYASKFSKEDGRMNWALEAEELYNRMRALDPWPGMTANFKGRPVKVLWGVPMSWEKGPSGFTGTYLGLRQGKMAILCGGDTIFGIEELQRPGKTPQRASDFVNGERLRVGERFA